MLRREVRATLAALVGLLPPERLETIIRAAHEHDLWSEALDVLRHVSERQRGALGDLAAAQEDAVLDSMVRTAQREDLWQERCQGVQEHRFADGRAHPTAGSDLDRRPVREPKAEFG